MRTRIPKSAMYTSTVSPACWAWQLHHCWAVMTLTERLKWTKIKINAESCTPLVDSVNCTQGLAVAAVSEPNCKSTGLGVEKIRCTFMPRQVSRITFQRSAGSSEAPEDTMYVSKVSFCWSHGTARWPGEDRRGSGSSKSGTLIAIMQQKSPVILRLHGWKSHLQDVVFRTQRNSASDAWNHPCSPENLSLTPTVGG